LFVLSFYLCVTNAVDFYHATEDNVKNGRFEYNRSKTESRRRDQACISIHIPDEAKPLVEKYIGKLSRRYGAYDYLDWTLFKGMKGLREIINHPELTLYWARHTFGTLARNVCRMSVDDDAVALNHIDNGHATTDIYIEKDWKIVDDVQFQVICLLYESDDNEEKNLSLNPDSNRMAMCLVAG